MLVGNAVLSKENIGYLYDELCKLLLQGKEIKLIETCSKNNLKREDIISCNGSIKSEACIGFVIIYATRPESLGLRALMMKLDDNITYDEKQVIVSNKDISYEFTIL